MKYTNSLNKKHYIIIALVALFVITNPSRSSFASYMHEKEQSGLGRDFNGIIFSIYSKYERMNQRQRSEAREAYRNGKEPKLRKSYYIGVLGNFFKSPF